MLLIKGFAGFLASFGFAILLNVRKKHIFLAGLNGALGSICYFALMDYQITSEAIAIFVASLLVSIISEVMARTFKCPTTIFLSCAIIPLVPGGKLYYTMLAIINNNLEEFMYLLIGTIADAGAIVIASAIVGSFIKMINRLSTNRG